MKKFLALIFLGAVFLSPIQSSYACSLKHDHLKKILHELNLSPEQHAKIKKIHEDAKLQLVASREQLKSIRKRINEDFKTKSITPSKESSYVDEEKEVIGSMLKIKMHERVESEDVLTDAQRAKLSEKIQQWEEKCWKEKESKKHQD